MRAELQRMGLSLDWEREFATCDPAYYRHQQKLFLDFLHAGLVDRKESWVNWDPVDSTVLANEQVIDGRGWRSGAPVEKTQLSQWFFRITELARRSAGGARHARPLARAGAADAGATGSAAARARGCGSSSTVREDRIDEVEVFTTRPDTLFGMSFLAIAPEHPLAAAVASHDPNAAAFIAECRRLGTSEETIETAEKHGLRYRAAGGPSVHRRRHLPGLDRQFRADGLRHRRDLRLPGA